MRKSAPARFGMRAGGLGGPGGDRGVAIFLAVDCVMSVVGWGCYGGMVQRWILVKQEAWGSWWVCWQLCSSVDVSGVGEGCVDRAFGAGVQGKQVMRTRKSVWGACMGSLCR